MFSKIKKFSLQLIIFREMSGFEPKCDANYALHHISTYAYPFISSLYSVLWRKG